MYIVCLCLAGNLRLSTTKRQRQKYSTYIEIDNNKRLPNYSSLFKRNDFSIRNDILLMLTQQYDVYRINTATFVSCLSTVLLYFIVMLFRIEHLQILIQLNTFVEITNCLTHPGTHKHKHTHIKTQCHLISIFHTQRERQKYVQHQKKLKYLNFSHVSDRYQKRC